MAFRFKRKETIADGFARIVREQVARAATALESASEEGVHDARRAIKRLRGILRLFRKALGETAFEHANRSLREVAHSLSAMRDAQVELDAFNRIAARIEHPGVAPIRRVLADALKAVAGEYRRNAPGPAAIACLKRIGAEPPVLDAASAWAVLGRGLRTTYRRARKAHAAAHEEHTTAALHEWRRRCKDLEYQLQLLRKSDPREMKARIRTAARINDLLGDDHDLAVLEATLAQDIRIPDELRDRLGARIARRRKKLQRRAFALGSRLLFEKPGVVGKQLASRWKRWHRGRD